MKKFSFLIVCLCAGLAFVSQAQDTERVAAGGEAPSLNGGLPSPWERPIGPGPRPIWYANGGSCSGDVTDDDCSGGSPLDDLEKGRVRPCGEPNVAPAGSDAPSLKGGFKPGLDHPVIRPRPIVIGSSRGDKGITAVTGMIDGLLNGSTDMADVNGDDKFDVSDVATVIDLLLMTQ